MDKRVVKWIFEEDVICEFDYICFKIDFVIEWVEVIELNISLIKD